MLGMVFQQLCAICIVLLLKIHREAQLMRSNNASAKHKIYPFCWRENEVILQVLHF